MDGRIISPWYSRCVDSSIYFYISIITADENEETEEDDFDVDLRDGDIDIELEDLF